MPIPSRDVERIGGALRRFAPIEWACLYGSALRRKDYEDVDIALRAAAPLAPAKKAALEAAAHDALAAALPRPRRLADSARESGYVDLHWFEDLPLALRHRVLREGKVLLNRRPRRARLVEKLVSREYLDFEPFYHRMTDRILDRMHSRLHDRHLRRSSKPLRRFQALVIEELRGPDKA